MTPSATGTYEFMSLHTGQLLRRKQFTILPITPAVIAQVERLAIHKKQPLIVGGCPLLEWRPDVPILDDTQEGTRSELTNNNDDPDFFPDDDLSQTSYNSTSTHSDTVSDVDSIKT